MVRSHRLCERYADTIVELLHWNEMASNAGGPRVIDAQVTRTNSNVRTVAYRAFYSMKLKDPAWQPSHRTVSLQHQ